MTYIVPSEALLPCYIILLLPVMLRQQKKLCASKTWNGMIINYQYSQLAKKHGEKNTIQVTNQSNGSNNGTEDIMGLYQPLSISEWHTI